MSSAWPSPTWSLGLGLCSSPASPIGLCTPAPWWELKLLQCTWQDRAGQDGDFLCNQRTVRVCMYVCACTYMLTLTLHLA